MIVATIDLNVAQAEAALKAYPRLLPDAAMKALRIYLMRVARYAMAAKFSGPGGTTNTLKVQTGLARRSVGQSPKVYSEAGGIRGIWGAEPIYVRRHEFGGTFTEYVPAHWRRRTALQKRRQRARLRSEGPSATHLQGGRIFVRAHTRTTTYRARHMIRDSMTRTRPLLDAYFKRAITSLLKTGKAPTIGDIARG